MTFHVSLVGRTDLSGEIYRQIRQAILDRRLRPGERLPPTRELATALRVSRSTVTVAYESLLAEGFATSHTGSGTFVSHHLETKRPASRTRRSTARAEQVRGVWKTISLPPPAFFRGARFDFRTGFTPTPKELQNEPSSLCRTPHDRRPATPPPTLTMRHNPSFGIMDLMPISA